jgi:spore germination protein GerM
LVFPNWDASGYVTEQRQLPRQEHLEGDLMTVMAALCEGPQTRGAMAALPSGTRPLAAFYDEAEGSVVLDFSHELVTRHPGGTAAENGTLTSILRTVALNFPEVQFCTLLVDGAQTETLAGHLVMDKPFQPQRWL